MKGTVKNMLLALDVGNTQTVLGVYRNDAREHSCAPVHQWRIATNAHHTADELHMKLRGLLDAEGITSGEIDGIALASVVPVLGAAWNSVSRRLTGADACVCSAETAGDLFVSTYPNPHEIGADRVADAIAARERFGSPVVVVDFGTATNIEVIDKDGFFVGGIIAPGLETSAHALVSHATKLAAIDLVAPQSAVGYTTEEAMQIGIVRGEAARVDGLVQAVFHQLGYDAPVVATGGLAPVLAPHTHSITDVMPDLTLEGLRLLWKHCKA